MITTKHIDDYIIYQIFNMIDTGNIDQVISYAKDFDIFSPKINRFQKTIVEKIQKRLDREGLSYDIVRPE